MDDATPISQLIPNMQTKTDNSMVENTMSYSDVLKDLESNKQASQPDHMIPNQSEIIQTQMSSDMNNIQTFRSVDDYQRARDVTQIRPMERTNAERMMQEQEKLLHDKMREKQYSSELNVMRNTEMNKKVMANFLRIGGG